MSQHSAIPYRSAVATGLCAVSGISAALIKWLAPGQPEVAIAVWMVCYLAGGLRPLAESLSNLLERKLTVDTLMVVAALGAAVLGDWLEGGVLLFLFSLSGTLEAYATYRTNRSIESLIQLRPQQANRISQDGSVDESILNLFSYTTGCEFARVNAFLSTERFSTAKPGSTNRRLLAKVFPFRKGFKVRFFREL